MSRRIIVTGAASGIGARLAAELLRHGDRVCAADLNLAPMQDLRAAAGDPSQLRIETLDVRDPGAWARVVGGVAQDWDGLDVLLNVAGVLRAGYVQEATPADVHFHLDINTKGVIFGTQAALRAMLPQKAGHIVNIASLAGLSPVPGLSLYSASKFAVRGYSLAAAYELRPLGIHVSVVCPDAVQTPMLDIQLGDERAALTFSGARSLTVEEIAGVVIEQVLTRRPIELAVPRVRGRLARLAGFSPALAGLMFERLRRKGLLRQKKLRGPVVSG